MLSTEGESKRFEFKRDVSGLEVSDLVAAANTVAMERSDRMAILVGVEETEDPVTGLMRGAIVGINNVERDKGKIVSRAATTLPVPVGLTIIEENTAAKPILRVEVWPTNPPHYDARGVRNVRHGASTRALTDEELVAFYLAREAEAFRLRFSEIAGSIEAGLVNVQSDLWNVQSDVEKLSREIGFDLQRIHESAEAAAAESEEGKAMVESIFDQIGDIVRSLEDVPTVEDLAEGTWKRLLSHRTGGWLAFTLRRSKKPAKDLERAETLLREVIKTEPQVMDFAPNSAELFAWRRMIGLSDSASARAWLSAARSIWAARFEPLPSEREPVDFESQIEARIDEYRARPTRRSRAHKKSTE